MVHKVFSHSFLTWSSKQSLEYVNEMGRQRQEGGNGYSLSTYYVPNTIGMWTYSLVTFWQSWKVHVFIFTYIMKFRKISYLGLCLAGNNWQSWSWFPSLIPKRKYNFLYQYWLQQFWDCDLPKILLLKHPFFYEVMKILELSFRSCSEKCPFPSHSTPGPIPRDDHNSKRHLHPSEHCSTVYNSQGLETTLMSISWGMDKKDVVHI